MITLIIGIVLGWVIPRPTWFASIETKLWSGIKNKLPKSIHWW